METGCPSINVVLHDPFVGTGGFSVDKDCLNLYYEGEEKNIELNLSVIEEVLGGKLNPLVLDIYKIANVVYVIDKTVEKTQYRPRLFKILMSISNKIIWDAQKRLLEGTLNFLTGDTFKFYFIQSRESFEPYMFKYASSKCVSLFSGGLDSLSGVKWLLDKGIDPVLISHPGGPIVSKAQSDLYNKLCVLSEREIDWHQINSGSAYGAGLKAKTYTQFSRSFLYLTLGLIISLEKGFRELYIFENGVIALNIPLTKSRIYTSTRTVHPKFISMYQTLISAIFGDSVRILNPFNTMTKGEVVSILKDSEFEQLISTSVSCSNISKLRWAGVKLSEIKHCGLCYPCIMRQIAVDYAGLPAKDDNYYQTISVPFSELPEDLKQIIFEMLDFSRKLDKCSSLYDALMQFPEFYQGESVDPDSLYKMVKRQNSQFINYLKRNADQTSLNKLSL